jgi:DNA ligase-associated metallophosphoesterase
MNASIVGTQLAGEAVVLHAERGWFWPRERLLAIADLHLGKGDAFRRFGVPLPRGGTELDLRRLDRLIDAFAPSVLLVLGDLVHGAVHPTAHWLSQWREWRRRHAALDVRMVRGNHDRTLSASTLEVADEGSQLARPPFLFTHDATRDADAGLHALGGHLHPVVVLRELGFSSRLPIFHFGATHSILPAFSAFTGGVEIGGERGDRRFACVGDRLIALPAYAN